MKKRPIVRFREAYFWFQKNKKKRKKEQKKGIFSWSPLFLNGAMSLLDENLVEVGIRLLKKTPRKDDGHDPG